MHQASSGLLALMLCICSAHAHDTFDDLGWRKYLTEVEGRRELQEKINKVEMDRASNKMPERWTYRDRSMSPGRRAELMSAAHVAHAKAAAESGFGVGFVIPALFICLSFISVAMLMVKNQGPLLWEPDPYTVPVGRKVMAGLPQPSSAKSSGPLSVLENFQFELSSEAFAVFGQSSARGIECLSDFVSKMKISSAFVVLRHSSTQGMDRAMDFLATAADAMASAMTHFTSKVRSRRRKKDEEDVDLLHLRPQCNVRTEDTYYSRIDNSLIIDLGKEDINLGFDPFMKDAELAQFVDEVSEEGTAFLSKTSQWQQRH